MACYNNMTKLLWNKKKLFIQRAFKSETDLLIDMPKSNSGNTARRFLRNHEITARITQLNKELIKRFDVLLEFMASV